MYYDFIMGISENEKSEIYFNIKKYNSPDFLDIIKHMEPFELYNIFGESDVKELNEKIYNFLFINSYRIEIKYNLISKILENYKKIIKIFKNKFSLKSKEILNGVINWSIKEFNILGVFSPEIISIFCNRVEFLKENEIQDKILLEIEEYKYIKNSIDENLSL